MIFKCQPKFSCFINYFLEIIYVVLSSVYSYSRQKEVLEMPNLIEVQKDSYRWFLEAGLKEVFEDISPIADYSGQLSLEFVDFQLCEEEVKYSIEECKERDATYARCNRTNSALFH